jgi:hypothetical protein
MTEAWVLAVEERIQDFAARFSAVYSVSEREVAASFEIGCFHALLDSYEDSCDLSPQNLNKAGEYRYLTTPSGNPANFSFVALRRKSGTAEYELRQQVRIRSHIHEDIMVTPDLVVLRANSTFGGGRDAD